MKNQNQIKYPNCGISIDVQDIKKTILLLLTIILTSYNSNSQGIKDNGKIENGIYTCNRFDWKINIPNGYEIRTVKDEQDLEEVGYETVNDQVPDGMAVRKNRPYLVEFGIDEKNYFSASFELKLYTDLLYVC